MWRDDAYLLDMVIAARRAMRFVGNQSEQAFLSDEMRQQAVIHCIVLVGEAAGRVSEECRSEHPEMPWAEAAGMRNRLVHAYRAIDMGLVWRTATEDLPALVGQLESLVPSDEEPYREPADW